MPPLFTKPFKLEAVAELGNLDFGGCEFAKLAAEWLRCTNPRNSALRSMSFGTSVWLYFLEPNTFVGFGSVGPTRTVPEGCVPPIGIIPQLGVVRAFHKNPPDADRDQRISSAIVRDLISKARERRFTTLTLFVHKDNTAAKNLYWRNQFIVTGPAGDTGYETMMLKLGAS